MRLIKRYVEEFANDMIRTYESVMKDQEPDVKKLWQKKIDETIHIKRICAAGIVTNYEAMKAIMEINDRQMVLKKKVENPLRFYVTSCPEFPELGAFFQDDIKDLNEAFNIYKKIDSKAAYGGKELGFKLKDGSIYNDMPCPLVIGKRIVDTFKGIDYFNKNAFVQQAVEDCQLMLSK